MNKDTMKIYNYISTSPHYLKKIYDLKWKYTNIKEFYLMLNYVIMDIVSKEPQFIYIPRENIDLIKLTLTYY